MKPHTDSACVIKLSGLGSQGRHGVLPQEQVEPQTFTADIVVAIDPPARDDIAATLDYRILTRCVLDRIEGESVQLIETLAQDILSDLLRLDRVLWAKVCVHKPQAPLGVSFTDLSVSIRGSNLRTPDEQERPR
jgi:dihydroneopterin aldolase